MKYVDNLLECKPEEIQHCFDPTAIVAIVPTPDTHSEHDQAVIVWSDATTKRFSIDGRYLNGVTPCFTYRSKKVKRLKPLHVILAEHPGYRFCLTSIDIGGSNYERSWIINWTGKTLEEINMSHCNDIFPDSFYEEVYEEYET